MLEQSIGAKKRKLEQVKMVMIMVVILVIVVTTIGYDNGYYGYNYRNTVNHLRRSRKRRSDWTRSCWKWRGRK